MSTYNFAGIQSQSVLDSIIQEAQWSKDGAGLEIAKLLREQQENAGNRGQKQEILNRAIGKENDLSQKLARLSATDPERERVTAYLAEATGRVTRLRFDANKSEGELQIQEQRQINLLQAEITENNAIIAGATTRKGELPA